jgi:hypothetical protein
VAEILGKHKQEKDKREVWSHRESNTGRSRILAGLTVSDEPQATVIPLHYRTDAELSLSNNMIVWII